MYKPKERKIYQFFDGERDRKVDPLAVERALKQAGGDQLGAWLKTLEMAGQIDPASVPADGLAAKMAQQSEDSLVGIVRTVRAGFGLKAFEDDGLTELECVELLCDFINYKQKLLESARPLASSPPSTAAAVSAGSVTAPTADSSGVPPESGSDSSGNSAPPS